MKKYQNLVSLGHFCSPAMEFKRISMRRFSGPFDWLITPCFSDVMTLINSNFEDFLNEEYMFQFEAYPQYYKNKKYNIDFYHDFSPFKSFQSQIGLVSQKYNRRIGRFYNIISQPTLFLRYITKDDIDYINQNYDQIVSNLKNFNPDNNIIFVVNNNVSTKLLEYIPTYYVEKDINDDVARKFLSKNDDLLQYIIENVEPVETKPESKNSIITLIKKIYRKVRIRLKLVYKHDKQCQV